LDKEDALLALERLNQLAQKEKTSDVIAKAKDKLDLVIKTLQVSTELSKIAAPYITLLAAHFS
jgi:hypothetical protein